MNHKLASALCALLLTVSVGAAAAPQKEAPVKPVRTGTAQRSVKQPDKVHLVWDWQAPGEKKSKVLQKAKLPAVNVLSPSWFTIATSYGEIIRQDVSQEYVDKAHANGYVVWPLIKNGQFEPTLTRNLLNNPEGREHVCTDLLYLCREYHLDGINLDFENMHPDDRDKLTEFVGEIASTLRPLGVKVSMDVTIPSENGFWSKCYDRKGLAEQLDYVMLMAYDEHSRLSPVAGSVASLPWVEQGLQKTLQEVPKEKLVLGMPLYMRLWKDEGGKVSATTLTMPQAEKLIKDKQLEPKWDSQLGQYYFEYKEGNTLYKVWQEDARSLSLKMALANRYDLAGTCYWRQGVETPDVWDKLEVLRVK